MTTAPALYAATPTVTISGRSEGLLSASLEELSVSEGTNGMVTCEARFQNVTGRGADPAYQLFDREVVDFGAPLVVSAGGGPGHGAIFSGHVTGVRAGYPRISTPSLTVLAEDRLQDLRMTRRTRAFEELTDASVFELIAADHRLRADVDLPGPTHRVIAQLDQSDLAFVRDRARRVGADIWLADDTLHVARRQSRREGRVVLSMRQNLREASLDADLAGQRTTVSVLGWDPATKQAIDERANKEVVVAESAPGGTVAAELLERAFGDRPDRIVHTVPLGPDEAREIARGQFLAMARRFVSGEVVADGDARIRVGAQVELVGLGQWFSGVYDVVATRHLFDLATGYRTHLHVERAELML